MIRYLHWRLPIGVIVGLLIVCCAPLDTVRAASIQDAPVAGAPSMETAETDGEVVYCSGQIDSDTTWTRTETGTTGPTELDCMLTVSARLTIDPSYHVSFRGDGGITVQSGGELNAVGTPEYPIVLNSTGTWIGLRIVGGTANLSNVRIEKGGRHAGDGLPAANILVTSGDLAVTSSTIAYTPGDVLSTVPRAGLYATGGRTIISDTLFTDHWDALVASGQDASITVTDSTFDRENRRHGVRTENGAQVELVGNLFSELPDYPIVTTLETVGSMARDNRFLNNQPSRILVMGGVSKGDLQLSVQEGLEGYEFAKDSRIPAGHTLTVNSGVAVLMGHSKELQVQGHLEALGTAAAPVRLTAADAAGRWDGLLIDGGSADLRHTIVEKGGAGQGSADVIDNLEVRDGVLTMESCQVLEGQGTSPQSIAHAGIYVARSHVDINDTLFSGQWDGLVAYGVGTQVSVTESSFIGNRRHAINVEPGAAVAVRDSVFENNVGYAIYADGAHPPQLLGADRFVTNGSDRVYLRPAALAVDAQLSAQEGLEGYEWAGTWQIPAGRRLDVEAGAVLMGGSNAELHVQGALYATGAEALPVRFTSVSGQRTDWRGLFFDGGTGRLAHAIVENGGSGFGSGTALANIQSKDADVEIVNSRVINGPQGSDAHQHFGVFARGGQLAVHDTNFSANGNQSGDYGLYAANVLSLTVDSSVFADNSGYPLVVPAASLGRVRGNRFQNNGQNRIQVDTTLPISGTVAIADQAGFGKI